MALPKLYDRVYWDNNTTPAINEDNLNLLSQAVDDIDDRVISLAGTIMEDVPQIQEDIEELEEDFALIDEKIADATSEANRATTKANEAAASVISAGDKALVSEGWAKGTQNGVPVGPTSPYHNNNSEYFMNLARSFTPQGYQDLVDDVAEAQEAITDIEGEKVSSNDAYVLRQCKGNSVDLGLIGGSIAWNQLFNVLTNSEWANNRADIVSQTASKIVLTPNSSTGTASMYVGLRNTKYPYIINHKYIVIGTAYAAKSVNLNIAIGTLNTGPHRKTIALPTATRKDISSILTITTEPSSRETLFYIDNAYGSLSASDQFYFENLMCIDLTQLFGSTIADYIYSLEQATAGAGVAWFRQYFRNLYYGYDAGSIQSVNPSKRIVHGKNLLPFPYKDNGTTNAGVTYFVNPNGSISLSGKSTSGYSEWLLFNRNTFPMKLKKGRYILFGGYSSNVRLTLGHTNPSTGSWESIASSEGSAVVFELSYDDDAIGITASVNANNVSVEGITLFPMVCYADVVNATWEPPQESTYLFDTSVQLRGIPKLVDNKLSYDGDIYTADGTVTRKYGIVDLSTLTWTYYSDNNYYISDSLANVIRRATDNASISNWLLCDKTIPNSANNVYLGNVGVAVASNGRLYYKDENTSSTTPPTSNLVYELATPTTESAEPFQNPQRAFIDGTEEFVDAGVTASTRDVSIPVGNESEYNTSVVLPISQDYTDGAMEILKEIVASSSDFADFKTKVAAL